MLRLTSGIFAALFGLTGYAMLRAEDPIPQFVGVILVALAFAILMFNLAGEKIR